jgi:hypothetical protein
MTMTKIQRRHFLRGFGTAVALPALEALVPRRAFAQARPQQRLGILFYPNGYPRDAGDYFDDGTMRHFAPASNDITFVAGIHTKLTKEQKRQMSRADDHGGGQLCIFSGQVAPRKPGSSKDFDPKVTFDQVMADALGWRTLYLSAYKGAALYQVAAAHGNTPFVKKTGALVDTSYNPAAVFEGMVASPSPEDSSQRRAEAVSRRKSVFDFLLDDVARYEKTISSFDRARLDQFVTSFRELEKKLQSPAVAGAPAAACDTGSKIAGSTAKWPPSPTEKWDALTSSGDVYTLKLELMYDLMIKAFECNSAQIAGLMISGGYGVHGWHDKSHSPASQAFRDLVNRSADYFVRTVQKLKATPDVGGTTLFDNTALVYCTDMNNTAHIHNYDRLCYAVAGKFGKNYKMGQRIRGNGVPVRDLFLTFMQDAGMRIDSFADSTGPLQALRA